MPAKRLLLKRTLVTLFAGLAVLGVLVAGSAALVVYYAPHYRQALAQRLGQRIDATVAIGSLALHWRWHGPMLTLSDVRITRHGESKPAVTAARINAGFSFAELAAGAHTPDTLALDAPRLALRVDAAGRIRLVHWSRPNAPPFDWQRLNAARGALRFVRIHAAQVSVRAPRLPGGQARIHDLDAVLHDHAGRLQWRAAARGPAWFDSLRGHGRLQGALPDVRAARVLLQCHGIDSLALARAAGLIDPQRAARLSGGEMTLRLQSRWQDRRLRQADGHIDLAAIADERQTQPVLPALTASLRAGPGAKPGHIAFALDHVGGALDGLAAFAVQGSLVPDTPSIRLTARHVPAALALRLARLKYPRLRDTRLRADIDRLRLIAGRATPLQLDFGFDKLHIDDPALTAGPIAGHYRQRGAAHTLRLDGGGGTLDVKRYLRGRLAIDRLGGTLNWHRSGAGWRFDADRLTLAGPSVDVTTSGHLRVPDHSAPVVGLDADISAPNMVRLFAHIPKAPDLPNPRLRDWLADAVKAGRIDRAHLTIAGAMDRFPFAHPRAGEGFHLRLHASGLNVVYKPGWPALKHGAGTLTLDGDALHGVLAQGTILGVKIGTSRGHVPDVREPVLHMNAHVKDGRAEQMLAFLAQSPLRKRFGKLVAALDFSGPAGVTTQLRIPLKAGLGKVEASGTIDARGDTLRHPGLPGPITGITGRVAFTKHGLEADKLAGGLLGVALHARLEPAAGDSQRIVADTTLALPENAALIDHYLPRPWLDYAHGATDVHIALQVARNGRISSMHLSSDMQGLGLELPAPLAKAAADKAPLAFFFDGGAHAARMRYDGRINMRMRFAGGRPSRMQVMFNDSAAQPPNADGIWIGGRLAKLDAPGWFEVLRHVLAPTGDAPAAPAGKPGLYFYGGDITVARLGVDDRYFPNSHVWTQRLNSHDGWRVNLDGPATQGQFVWRRGQPRTSISGNLARLALKTRPQEHSPPAQSNNPADDQHNDTPVIWPDVSPLALPRLDIDVSHVLLDGTDFGTLSIRAKALPNGWQLDRAALTNGGMTGWATGRWTRTAGQTRARAETKLHGHGLAHLLRTLGYPATVKAKKARIHARLKIDANPNGLDSRALQGTTRLALDKGTLLSVEPGPARVLGLLNLYVLPRRLRLDFRDVTKKGLAFDRVRANFDIDNGNAYAQGNNVHIDTPSSTIRISGRIGLAARDYDEHVKIAPHVGFGVTLAGTVFGGPIVGAAMFALQALFKKPIQKYSSVQYRLKGSWANPEIAEPKAEQ